MLIGIYGDNSYIEFNLIELWGFPESTCFKGGYDGKWYVSLKSDNYEAKDIGYLATGELIVFFDDLKTMYKSLTGSAKLALIDTDLEVNVEVNDRGQIAVSGIYKAKPEVNNKLCFEFFSNQSYLVKSLDQFGEMINCYGGMRGLKQE